MASYCWGGWCGDESKGVRIIMLRMNFEKKQTNENKNVNLQHLLVSFLVRSHDNL
jgi:hypothetical protein